MCITIKETFTLAIAGEWMSLAWAEFQRRINCMICKFVYAIHKTENFLCYNHLVHSMIGWVPSFTLLTDFSEESVNWDLRYWVWTTISNTMSVMKWTIFSCFLCFESYFASTFQRQKHYFKKRFFVCRFVGEEIWKMSHFTWNFPYVCVFIIIP